MTTRQAYLLTLLSKYALGGSLAYLKRAKAPAELAKHEIAWRKKAILWASKMSLQALEAMGCEVICEFQQKSQWPQGPALIVSNHLSYMDVLVINSQHPCVFITSTEARDTLAEGWLSKIGGSLFVERRHKSQLLKDIEQITLVLKQGFSVVLFPEGKTGEGQELLPFKHSLFKCALDAQVPIVPVCLNYTEINGEKINSRNKNLFFYHGELGFVAHVGRLIRGVKTAKIRLKVLEPLTSQNESDRKKLAEKARDEINKNYVSVR